MEQENLTILYLTGSSSGIGRAIAEAALADPAYRVHGFARREGPVHPAYAHHSIDLSDQGALSDFHFPEPGPAARIVLINNAGVLGEMAYLGQLEPADLISAYTLNLAAPAILMNKFIAQFQQTPAEKIIINISTGAAKNPYDGWSTYCAGKAGLDMLTRVAALEQEKTQPAHPFIIKAIAPGVVDTEMQTTIRATAAKNFSRLKKFIDLHTEGKLKTPEACAQSYLTAIANGFTDYDLIDKIR